MARKLKSDKVLFTRHAAAGVLERRHGVQRVGRAGHAEAGDAYLFLFKQAMWAALGLLVPVMMRVDYRVSQPIVIWTALGAVGLRWCRAVQRAEQRQRAAGSASAASASSRRSSAKLAGHLLRRRAARAAHGSDRRVRHALLPIGLVARRDRRLILLEPDFGTAVSIAARHRGVMVFAAGLNYRYLVGVALRPFRRCTVVMTPTTGAARSRRSSIRGAIRSATASR